MIEDARKHLDLLLVIVMAMAVYHVALEMTGHSGGITASKRWF